MIYYIGNKRIVNGKCFEYTSMEEAIKYLQEQTILSVDTETEGMDFTCKKMIMFQIGDGTNQYVIDTRSESIEPLRSILESKKIIKILHNAKFDYKFIKKWANIELAGIYDTFLVERILHCGKRGPKYGLKDLVLNYLGKELDKEPRNKFVNLQGAPYTDVQIQYGAKDVEYLIQLRELQLPQIAEKKLEQVVDLECKAVLAFADIEYNGLEIDREAWLNLDKRNADKAKEYFDDLDNAVIQDPRLQRFVLVYIQGDLFTDQKELRKVGVNWDSPKQVLEVFKELIPNLENVNGKELYKHRNYGLVSKYVRYKEYMKLCTSYGKPFFKYLKGDGMVHTNFHQILDTGRVSSSHPNMQQIPADNSFRNCFIAPEGWSFVSSDYTSQELNVIAFGSKDPVWIQALEDGQDLHSVCAELVYKQKWSEAAEDDCAYVRGKVKCECPQHQTLRNNVKAINFGLAYGMGPHKLADTLQISKDQATKLIEEYFKAFPSIKGFLERLGNFGKQYGYIKTFPPFNRKRWFSTWYPKIWNNKSSMMEIGSIERASKNTPIQGASADMTKLALIYIHEYIKENNIPVKMVMTVHDQIDTICNNSYTKTWKKKMTELMEKAAKVVVTNGLLKADTNISKTWSK
tara:strand:- start:294 stop:2186 length:1893 start_codon:yes stop_codon:yes gene_type:complete